MIFPVLSRGCPSTNVSSQFNSPSLSWSRRELMSLLSNRSPSKTPVVTRAPRLPRRRRLRVLSRPPPPRLPSLLPRSPRRPVTSCSPVLTVSLRLALLQRLWPWRRVSPSSRSRALVVVVRSPRRTLRRPSPPAPLLLPVLPTRTSRSPRCARPLPTG